jgi:PBP1b-binding outer membrane lipoprotein LpoB
MKKMKKLFLSLCFAAVLLLSGCSDDDPKPEITCEESTAAFQAAFDAFTTTPNIANCNAAKEAYLAALDACSDELTPEQLEALQDIYDGLPDCVE